MASEAPVRTPLLKRNKILATFIDVFNWYPSHYPKEERKLLFKLDLSILVFASLAFFCKFLDQSNITNAYVSGLKEDLRRPLLFTHLNGNELNYLNVAYYVAYIVGQVPLVLLQARPGIAPYLLPTLEIVWAVLTFSQSQVTNIKQLYALRALVGFFEAPCFAGTHFILGSFYRKEELFKRAGVWFMGNSLGSMFSGYLQAAAYKNLNGANGMAGWQWLFIIDGVITLPIAFLGFAVFPGLPNSKKPWYLSKEEHELCRTRMPSDQVQPGGITLSVVKRAATNKFYWLCCWVYICLIQTSYFSGYMALWLKSLAPKYSVPQINVYPTFVNLLSALSSWLGTTLAQTISPVALYTFSTACILFGTIILTVWDVSEGLKFAAFYIAGGVGCGMISPILYSWINVTFRSDPELRALTISSMMTVGYATYAGIPVATFATVDAPRFPKGYPTSVGASVLLYVSFVAMYYMAKRKWSQYEEHPNKVKPVISRLDSNSSSFDEDKKTSHLGQADLPPLPILPAVGHGALSRDSL